VATPYLFVAPLFVVFAAFYLWPAISTVLSSLFQWGMLNPWQTQSVDQWNLVGGSNYSTALSNPDYWNAALNSAIWLIVLPTLVLAISFPVAVMIWNAKRFSGLFRAVFILPMTISLTAAGVIWSFIYDPSPSKGVLNGILNQFGLADASFTLGPLHVQFGHWLSNAGVLNLGFADIRLVNVFVIIPAVWAFAGFGVVTFSAALTSVPDELIDAAKMDGAGTLQLVRHVIVPTLRPTIMVVTIVSVIFALRTFDIVFVTTGGGPAQSTEVLAMLIWQQVFQFLDTPQGGLAAAGAVIMSAAMIVLAIPYIRSTLRSEL
jgi:ABC-type sugar transport system permease subunit